VPPGDFGDYRPFGKRQCSRPISSYRDGIADDAREFVQPRLVRYGDELPLAVAGWNGDTEAGEDSSLAPAATNAVDAAPHVAALANRLNSLIRFAISPTLGMGGALRIQAARRAPVDARAEVQAASTSTTA
jgi:hypothetical protein